MNNYERYYYEPAKYKKKKSSSKLVPVLLTVAVAFGSLGFGFGAGTAAFRDSEAQGLAYEALTPETLPSALAMPLISSAGEVQALALAAPESAVVSAIRIASDSVVSINTISVQRDIFNRPRLQQGAGSGIISAENEDYIFIITNHHVIEYSESVEISIDDYISVEASPVGSDREADIAVIRVSKADLHAANVHNYKIATFGDASSLEIGQTVIAMGNAMGEGQSATLGIVSAKGREIRTPNNVSIETIQTDAAINGGNSGGALVNLQGEVIGVNTAKLRGVGIEGIGFAIPSNLVQEIFEEIMERSAVQRPFVGFLGMTIDNDLKELHSLASVGVFIGEVTSDSGAWDAGMRVGDIITNFAGHEILTLDRLLELIPLQEIGSYVEIVIMRSTMEGEQEILLSVEIRDANVPRNF